MIHLAKIKYDMIIMKNCVYWSTRWINLDQKILLQLKKYSEINYLFNNPKNTAAVTSTQKNRAFQNSNSQKILLICQVHPPGILNTEWDRSLLPALLQDFV